MHTQTARFVASVLTCLPGDITEGAMQGWIENPNALKSVLRGALYPPKEEISEPIADNDPHTFWKTRPGLYVDRSFLETALSKVGKSEPVKGMSHFDLPRNMTDSEIEKTLGESHIWNEPELHATLRALIEVQWGGKRGELLNKGYANLFYTQTRVVSVLWNSAHRSWNVVAWERDVIRWNAGDRVFSPAPKQT